MEALSRVLRGMPLGNPFLEELCDLNCTGHQDIADPSSADLVGSHLHALMKKPKIHVKDAVSNGSESVIIKAIRHRGVHSSTAADAKSRNSVDCLWPRIQCQMDSSV